MLLSIKGKRTPQGALLIPIIIYIYFGMNLFFVIFVLYKKTI